MSSGFGLGSSLETTAQVIGSNCLVENPCVNICHCDWLNKEAVWPITGQVEASQDLQTKEQHGQKRRRSLRDVRK